MAAQAPRLHAADVTLTGLSRDADRLAVAAGLTIETCVGVRADPDFDVTIESSGRPHALAVCLERAAAGSTSSLGIFGQPVTAGLDSVLFTELTVSTGFASRPRSWERARRLAATGSVALEPLVSEVVPLADWKRAFEGVRCGSCLTYALDPR
jgi:L-iditol 2-dehydrogenase